MGVVVFWSITVQTPNTLTTLFFTTRVVAWHSRRRCVESKKLLYGGPG